MIQKVIPQRVVLLLWVPNTGQGAQEVPVPRTTRPRGSRALGLKEASVTVDPVSLRLWFPANTGPAGPDLVTPAIKRNKGLSSKGKCVPDLFFPRKWPPSLQNYWARAGRPLISPVTPPGPPVVLGHCGDGGLTLPPCFSVDSSSG